MRVQSATFHNFRRLINTRLKLGDNITVLVGQNESGKSTILEGIYNTIHNNRDSNLTRSFSKLKDEKKFEIRVVLEVNESDLKGIISLAGLSPHVNDRYLVNQQFVFEWKGHDSNETKIVHSKWEGLRVRYGNNPRYDSIMRHLTNYADRSIILLRPNDVIIDSEPIIDASNLIFVNKNNNSLNHLYSLKAKEAYRFTNLQNDVKKFFKNTDFNIIKKDSRLEVIIFKYFQGREYQFTLDEMSDGFRELLSILVKIYVFEPRLILLDEPDTNLHSNLVRELITYLKNLKIQTLIATHNEILINEFKEKDVKYVYPISAISSRIKDYSMFNLNQVFTDLGLNLKYKKSLLLSSQLIILLEGNDDEQYLNKEND